ncbi:30S ribosomal protein S4 [Patescibacteria group bacterium]|nr:MAG: 30S ribosomal protein S4 [Patescibacteria group bacterium]
MGRQTDAKCRRCRRAGEKLFLKGDRCATPKCAMIRKAYVPGVHGKKPARGGRGGGSEFSKQLAMKQKIKRIYGVLEKQFRKHFEDASKRKGVLGDMLVARLEMRLDNVVHRMGFAPSRSLARQLVNHGSFKVNGRKVTIPSFEVKVGDVVKIAETKQGKTYFKNNEPALKNKKDFPSWISFDASVSEGKVVALPSRSDVGVAIDPQLVVEYYSR